MKKILLKLLLTFLISINSFSQEKVTWHTDANAALQLAIKENKKVMFFFTGSDWCGWCIKITSADHSLKSLVLKTSFCNLIHQPHQSDPVKKNITFLFSFIANCKAALASVCQVTFSCEKLWIEVKKVSRSISNIFFIILIFLVLCLVESNITNLRKSFCSVLFFILTQIKTSQIKICEVFIFFIINERYPLTSSLKERAIIQWLLHL